MIKSSFAKQITTLISLILLVSATLLGQTELKKKYQPSVSTEDRYLPSEKGLKLLSIGSNQVLSHLLWFKTINYFGKQLRSEKNYQYLNHFFNLVTILNPKADYVYDFGATMLSWETNQPDKAIALLDRAIKVFPDNWYFYYLRGFNYLYFLNDPQKAKEDYTRLAQIEDAPENIKKMQFQNFDTVSTKFSAIRMLRGLIATAPDPQTKQLLTSKLQDLIEKNKIK